ncbi:radical SAM/SPASM domain-containing protein [Halanaerobium hydrogeniformans]|uniref:Radical SAM domain protein n=1 Tax=Halanaerobium hydrogeniformans TaxID=656519 RepID=E4RMC5_HALHG|nr:radical SAM protein [Halanaerobium hydrogeniformans]ADQ14456.1 Radical SAM domain protein [Halanaerobium hydrogeniformans]
MSKWKLSKYTVVFRCESGDAIFHNSFMGAIAVIPSNEFSRLEEDLYQEIDEKDFADNCLKELCENGFFFPSQIDEADFVEKILKRENRSKNLDLVILPHENCNFRCDYCYETHQGGIMETEIVEGLKLFTYNKVAEYSSLNTRWFGGEPLLARDIIYQLSDSFLESCERAGIPYSSHMTTNAYLLTPEVVDELLKRKINKFQITFDGPEIIHDSTRKLAGGGKTFKVILNNLLAMKNRDLDFYVSLRVNFNNASLVLMEDLFRLISENFGNDPRFGLYFRPIGKYGGPNDEKLEICQPEYAKLIEMELTEEYSQFGYLDKLVKKSLQPHGQVCYAAKESSLIIGADGTIYKCSVAFEDPKNHVGKLKPDGTMAIDKSRWNLWVANEDSEASKCISCPVKPICQGKYCPRYTIRKKEPICAMKAKEYEKLVQIASSYDGMLL